MDQQATKPEPCGEYSGPELKLCISQASGKGERAGEISPRVQLAAWKVMEEVSDSKICNQIHSQTNDPYILYRGLDQQLLHGQAGVCLTR